MAEPDTQKRWAKANTVMMTFRFMKKSDADLIEFLADKKGTKGTIIKAALREYIANHPESSED